MKPRVQINRVILPREGSVYAGECPLFGYRYFLEIRRATDAVEVTVFDGPVQEAYRIPFLDDEEPTK